MRFLSVGEGGGILVRAGRGPLPRPHGLLFLAVVSYLWFLRFLAYGRMLGERFLLICLFFEFVSYVSFFEFVSCSCFLSLRTSERFYGAVCGAGEK